MKIAIMQPYLFPYIGYYQLIGAVDRFVIQDDVTFIKGGWINRNRWLADGTPTYFTIPVQNVSSSRKISQSLVALEKKTIAKLLRVFRQEYGKAPYFRPAEQLLEHVLTIAGTSIAQRAVESLRVVAEYLGLTTAFIPTATVYENGHLKAGERVIDICRREHARIYINAIGGTSLYDKSDFEARGIELKFLRPRPRPYKQSNEHFVESLSILDVIAFNSPRVISDMLHEYDLS